MSNNSLMKTLDRIVDPENMIPETMRALQRQRLITKGDHLGQVDALSTKLIAITGTMAPQISPRTAIICAADHGIAAEKISTNSPDSTAQAINDLLNKKTQSTALAQKFNTSLSILDVGTAKNIPPQDGLHSAKICSGTNSFLTASAMSEENAVKAIAAGIAYAAAQIQAGSRLLLIGNIGAGSTIACAALTSVLTGLEIPEVTGPGLGIGISGWRRKCEIIEQAILFHNPSPQNGLELLSKIGGLEIAAITGIVLEATAQHIPVLLDGIVPATGAAMATLFEPSTKKTVTAAHTSSDPGHKALLDLLDLTPILNLDIKSSDGAGALLAVPILEAALLVDSV